MQVIQTLHHQPFCQMFALRPEGIHNEALLISIISCCIVFPRRLDPELPVAEQILERGIPPNEGNSGLSVRSASESSRKVLGTQATCCIIVRNIRANFRERKIKDLPSVIELTLESQKS